jgi:hypothetical protein
MTVPAGHVVVIVPPDPEPQADRKPKGEAARLADGDGEAGRERLTDGEAAREGVRDGLPPTPGWHLT